EITAAAGARLQDGQHPVGGGLVKTALSAGEGRGVELRTGGREVHDAHQLDAARQTPVGAPAEVERRAVIERGLPGERLRRRLFLPDEPGDLVVHDVALVAIARRVR